MKYTEDYKNKNVTVEDFIIMNIDEMISDIANCQFEGKLNAYKEIASYRLALSKYTLKLLKKRIKVMSESYDFLYKNEDMIEFSDAELEQIRLYYGDGDEIVTAAELV